MIDVKPAVLKKIIKVLSGNVPEYEVLAYGARAAGRAHQHSYLDLAVMSDTPLGEVRLKKLSADFLAAGLPFRVETVDWAATGGSYRKEIKRTAVTLRPSDKK
jgi:type I restriction enzyme S subunit